MSVLARHLNILDHTLSSLWRRRLKNLSVLLVFAGVIFLIASFQLVTRALTETAEQALVAAPEITIQKMSAGRQVAVPLAYSEKLSGIFGIRRVVPRVWGYYFDEVSGANYTVLGLERDRMPASGQLDLVLDQGESPAPGRSGAALIGRSVQQGLERKGGSLLSLFRPDLSMVSFTVAGVFKEETDILTNDLIVLDIDDARDLFLVPEDVATDLCVYVANQREVPTIAKKIADALPDTRVVTRAQIRKTYQVVFGWRSGFASVCLLTALAAFVIFAWDKASGLSPEERREISILKLLGWETRDILAIRLWEGILVAGLAFVLGCTLAYIHVAFFGASLFRPVMVGWSVISPSLRLAPTVQLSQFLLIFCFSVLPYMAATVIPAWSCASVPAESALGGV